MSDDAAPSPSPDSSLDAPVPLPALSPESSVLSPAPTSPSADPLAHRRAEPRLFTFLWTLYLLLTVAGSIIWMTRSSALSASSYGPAARVMLVVVAAGATLLWPMVRLSQLPPRATSRPGGRPRAKRARRASGTGTIAGAILGACFTDAVVVAAPVQTIIWPMAIVAGWPIDVVGALALMFILWPAFIAAALALCFAVEARLVPEPPAAALPGARTATMLLLVLITTAAPAAVLAAAAVGHPLASSSGPTGPGAWAGTWLGAASPFTFVHAITGHGLSGPTVPVPREHWWALGAVGCAATLTWVVAGAIAPRRSSG